MAIPEKPHTPNRDLAESSVLTSLRSPRLLTREVLAGLVLHHRLRRPGGPSRFRCK